MLNYIHLVCVSKDRLNLSIVMDALHIILPSVMFSRIPSANGSEHFSSAHQGQGTVPLCSVYFIAFSSAFQISAYPISITFDWFSFVRVFVCLPLSNRAGLGKGNQSSAFR